MSLEKKIGCRRFLTKPKFAYMEELKPDLYQPDQSQDEGAKRHGSDVISNHPPEAPPVGISSIINAFYYFPRTLGLLKKFYLTGACTLLLNP